MKAILIDDDLNSLRSLERALVEIDGFTSILTFTEPLIVIDTLPQEKPDIIFMETRLPNLSGIMAAKCIKSSLPQVHVVFVSSQVKYAVKAFEVNALDFILKPLQPQRLLKTINRLKQRRQHGTKVLLPQLSNPTSLSWE